MCKIYDTISYIIYVYIYSQKIIAIVNIIAIAISYPNSLLIKTKEKSIAYFGHADYFITG